MWILDSDCQVVIILYIKGQNWEAEPKITRNKEKKPPMALAMEKQELTKVYDKQTDTWKLVKKDHAYTEQLSTIE